MIRKSKRSFRRFGLRCTRNRLRQRQNGTAFQMLDILSTRPVAADPPSRSGSRRPSKPEPCFGLQLSSLNLCGCQVWFAQGEQGHKQLLAALVSLFVWDFSSGQADHGRLTLHITSPVAVLSDKLQTLCCCAVSPWSSFRASRW